MFPWQHFICKNTRSEWKQEMLHLYNISKHYETFRQKREILSYYNWGSRKLQILHIRLRNKTMTLNAHLFSKSTVPSPLSKCGVVENNSRYVLQPPPYLQINIFLFWTICNNICLILSLIHCFSHLAIKKSPVRGKQPDFPT